MAINFPNSPTTGQIFSSGGTTWQWDGVKWIPAASGQNYLPLTGGSLTGDLTITSPDGNNLILDAASGEWPGIQMNIPASGEGAWIGSYIGGYERWEIDLGNGVAEGSGNVGSNFQIARYANNGNFIDDPIVINRSTGLVSFSQHAPVNDSSYNAADTYWVQNQLAGRQNRNRLINGSFLVDQWNNYASITPIAAGFMADRWKFTATQAGKFTSQAVSAGSTWGVPIGSGLSLTVAAAFAVAATDYFQFYQVIEWQNIMDCAFSRSVAQPLTLSFWAWSSVAGTYGGAITNNAGTRSYPFTYSLPVANTWYYISITIPGDTAGTWSVATNAAGLLVHFDLGSGANYRGTAGSWSSNNYCGATGTVSLVATAGAGFVIANIQLEIGSQATPFDYRSFGQETILCQRYFQNITAQSWIFNGSVTAGSTYYCYVSWPVQMRATPTLTVSNVNTGGGFPATVATQGPSAKGVEFSCVCNTTTPAGYFCPIWTANAEI